MLSCLEARRLLTTRRIIQFHNFKVLLDYDAGCRVAGMKHCCYIARVYQAAPSLAAHIEKVHQPRSSQVLSMRDTERQPYLVHADPVDYVGHHGSLLCSWSRRLSPGRVQREHSAAVTATFEKFSSSAFPPARLLTTLPSVFSFRISSNTVEVGAARFASAATAVRPSQQLVCCLMPNANFS